jgi:hypothetical protein
MCSTFLNFHQFIWTCYFIQGSDTVRDKRFMKNNPSACTCVALWPFLALASLKRCLQSSVSPTGLLHPHIHGFCNASLWTVSSLIVLGFPAGIVLWNFPLRIFWGVGGWYPVSMSFVVQSRVPLPCGLYWAIYS